MKRMLKRLFFLSLGFTVGLAHVQIVEARLWGGLSDKNKKKALEKSYRDYKHWGEIKMSDFRPEEPVPLDPELPEEDPCVDEGTPEIEIPMPEIPKGFCEAFVLYQSDTEERLYSIQRFPVDGADAIGEPECLGESIAKANQLRRDDGFNKGQLAVVRFSYYLPDNDTLYSNGGFFMRNTEEGAQAGDEYLREFRRNTQIHPGNHSSYDGLTRNNIPWNCEYMMYLRVPEAHDVAGHSDEDPGIQMAYSEDSGYSAVDLPVTDAEGCSAVAVSKMNADEAGTPLITGERLYFGYFDGNRDLLGFGRIQRVLD